MPGAGVIICVVRNKIHYLCIVFQSWVVARSTSRFPPDTTRLGASGIKVFYPREFGPAGLRAQIWMGLRGMAQSGSVGEAAAVGMAPDSSSEDIMGWEWVKRLMWVRRARTNEEQVGGAYSCHRLKCS